MKASDVSSAFRYASACKLRYPRFSNSFRKCKLIGNDQVLIPLDPNHSGWSGGAMVLGNFPVPGRPIWIIVGQGPTALAESSCGGCLDIFSVIYHFSRFFPPSGRRLDIYRNTVSKGG